MKLTPLDIRKHQFEKRFRGYDPDQVRAFLDSIAQQWEEIVDENRVQTDRIREMRDKLQHYERVEEALQEALTTARENARRTQDNAERKGKLIIEEAEMKAQRRLQDAEQERFQLRQELARLSGRQSEITARMRAFLMAELEVLAEYAGDEPAGYLKLVPSRSQAALSPGNSRSEERQEQDREERRRDQDVQFEEVTPGEPSSEQESDQAPAPQHRTERQNVAASPAESERIRRLLDELD
ncbi:hypothetical protein BH23BAC4_BH23BAC4_11270 [soil metagenome]